MLEGAVTYSVLQASALPPTLADKVEFLSHSNAYPGYQGQIAGRETHMSWVFLTGDKAYKLKKPVRFSYLDFSTLALREAACRAEIRLNRRLASDVYLGVVPLRRSAATLSICGSGEIVDWLVVMRRLDESQMLDRALAEHRVQAWQIDRLVATLVQFYRRATPVFISPERHLAAWRASLLFNRQILLDPRFGLPAGLVRHIDRAQRRFLALRRSLLADRVRGRHIVDAHGDLRPEHIFLGDPLYIIDCLEFNKALRAADPLDEVAFLSVECERLGNSRVGRYIRRRIVAGLQDGPTEELFTFYRCYRATLRARLAIAHLLEPSPRSPEKWPALTLVYLQLAAADAVRLAKLLRAPFWRPHGHHGDAKWPPQTEAPPARPRAYCARPQAQAGMRAPYR
jgi:aminoglycoside phosphotransferase family enzyme